VRGCSCRGPHAGFVHIRCLVKNAEERGEYDDVAYDEALLTCTQCRQEFQGPVMVALQRAAYLHFAGRVEMDRWRQLALRNLGMALYTVGRLDEALVINEEHLTTMRRLYGPDDHRTILVEEGLAATLRNMGGPENLQRAVGILERTHALKIKFLGRDHRDTLEAGAHLAATYNKLGKLSEGEALYREVLAALRRILGEHHARVLFVRSALAQTVALQGHIDDAVSELEEMLPLASRVLGPNHHITLNARNLLHRILRAVPTEMGRGAPRPSSRA